MTRYRYSGTLSLALTLLDATTPDGRAQYRVVLRGPYGNVWRATVNGPAWARFAHDSPQAFDDAARAALSFADSEGFPTFEQCDFDEPSPGRPEIRLRSRRPGAPKTPGTLRHDT